MNLETATRRVILAKAYIGLSNHLLSKGDLARAEELALKSSGVLLTVPDDIYADAMVQADLFFKFKPDLY